jgi:hypothetical protein
MGRNNELEDLAKLAGVADDPAFASMIRSPLLSGPKREKLAKFLRGLVAARCPFRHAFLPAPSMTVARAGVIPMGRTITGLGPQYFFHHKLEESTGGVLICAPTGGGKTLLLTHLSLAYHRQGCPVWLYDTEGDITAYMVRAAPDVFVVDYTHFRQEMFEPPPGTSLEWREYLSKLISSWRAPLFVGDGMANIAREVATEIYQRDGGRWNRWFHGFIHRG